VATLGPGLGNVISANTVGDYNTIQAKLSKVLGPPTDATPRYGYNQLVNSSQVSVGNKVTLSHWTNLRSDMIRARGHQSGSASESNNLTLPTSADLITEAVRQQYFDYATLIDTYRDTVGTGQFTIEPEFTAQRIDDWNGNLQSTITMNFGDNATMRAFFNAGGVVKFSVRMTGTFNSFSTVKDNTWTTMFTQMGTITFGRDGTTLDQGSTGTTTATGFFALTNSYQLVFSKNAPAGNYSTNQFLIYATVSSGTLVFAIQYNDSSTGGGSSYIAGSGNLASGQETQTIQGGPYTPGGVGDEYIDGIITQSIVVYRASGSYVSIASPTLSLTGDFTGGAGAVYGLSASNYAVNEGDSVVVTLQTRNVANGTFVTYSCTGSITYTPTGGSATSRFSAGSTSSYFTVNNNIAQISFTIANNYWTDGLTSFNVVLTNGLAATTIYINDTSTTPIGNQLYTTVTTNNWLAPTGVRSVAVALIGGGGGGGDFAGGGGGGGQFRIITATVVPGSYYAWSVGGGAQRTQTGASSSFAGITAAGGSPGSTGSSTGHKGTNVGGYGGTSGQAGQAGGAGAGSSAVDIMYIAGGGGAGAGGDGQAAPQQYQGGQGGPGIAFTYYGTTTQYICGGGGGGGNYAGLGVYGGAAGGPQSNDGFTATGYGGGGGGGGVAYPANYAGESPGAPGPAPKTLATFSIKYGGNGAQGFVHIFWPGTSVSGTSINK